MKERIMGFIEAAELPRVPNFIYLDDGTLHLLCEVSDTALREFGRRYTEAIITRAREQREAGGGL